MKKWLLLLLTVSMIVTVGCTKDEDVDEFAELITYVEDMGGFRFLVAAAPDDTTLTAEAQAATFLAGFELVVDVRAADAYNAGHIEGAVNWAAADFKTKLAEANPTGTVLIVCYTGQTASHLQTVASLMGYDAKILKWGMSGWSTTTNSWGANTKGDFTAWSMEDTEPTAETYDAPELDTGEETGEDILDAMLDVTVAGGLKGASAAATMADEYVINYWSAADWNTYGHIENAYRITPGDILSTASLYNIPSDRTVYVYCYTGQTSAALTSYLNTLGYTTLSIKYGVNGMIYPNHPVAWHDRHVDLPLVQ